GIEVAVAALEDRRRTAHALSGQQRALQAELAGPAEVQAFGVAAAPRELEKPGTRRARDAQRIGEPVLVEAVELADRGRGAERSLGARVVKAAHSFQPDGRARDARGHFEADGQRGEKR